MCSNRKTSLLSNQPTPHLSLKWRSGFDIAPRCRNTETNPLCFVLVFPLVIISQPENSSCCQRPCRVCHCRQQGGTRWTVAQVDHIPGPCLSLSGCLSIYLPLSACLPACGELAAEKRGLFSEQGAVGDKGGQQEDRKRRGCFQKDNDKEEVVQHKSFGT